MKRVIGRIRRGVPRQGADTYLLLTLLSFAASVALTRLFLELTGYPQLGNSTLHIAHVLWGGLALFVAALLPLLFANRWVYLWGALLAGLGVGLFIDEVGKFITQTNDYFFPAAAPIIYAFFLLVVVVYRRASRPRANDPRAELYAVLDSLQEVLDRDLSEEERMELEMRLEIVQQVAMHPDLKRLAANLLEFINSEMLMLAPERPNWLERQWKRIQALEARWFTRTRLKAILLGGLLALGSVGLIQWMGIILSVQNPARLEALVAEWVNLGQIDNQSGAMWLIAQLTLEGLAGLGLILAAGLLLTRWERRGAQLAEGTLLLYLAGINLLVFYFEQFSTIITASIQFALLIGVLRFESRFLDPEATVETYQKVIRSKKGFKSRKSENQ
ncbi:MAG: hypothetical protein PVF49_02340 [Anaerolineales bacterium]|jgi:hypothetical protein